MEVNKKNKRRTLDFLGLIEVVQRDFAGLKVAEGRKFMFRPPRTIFVPGKIEDDEVAKMRFLHEVGHAVFGKFEYKSDLGRLKIERGAWEKAVELAEKYGVEMDEEVIEADLDSYRDWLHRRGTCEECGSMRYQGQDGGYYCPICDE